MNEDTSSELPQAWAEALARADADLLAGRTVPASVVRRRIEKTIADMKEQAAMASSNRTRA